MAEISTKPYLLRALFEWCVDNGYTPHIAVKVDSRTQVPAEYVKGGEITLNISPNAVHKLQMGNDLIEFSPLRRRGAPDFASGREHLRPLCARDRPRHDLRHRGRQAERAGEGRVRGRPDHRKTTTALPAPPSDPKKPGGGKPTLRRINKNRGQSPISARRIMRTQPV